MENQIIRLAPGTLEVKARKKLSDTQGNDGPKEMRQLWRFFFFQSAPDFHRDEHQRVDNNGELNRNLVEVKSPEHEGIQKKIHPGISIVSANTLPS